MAYSELVKRFDRIRDYMRDFLVYGFKTREDFTQKSGRTYDNERRRIESWLGADLRWEYGAGGKRVFLSMDASELAQNPLYRAWRSKSFTDNDINLHFFLLDLLSDGVPRSAEALTDELLTRYGEVFETQTVRRKLKEYAGLGVLTAEKEGRGLRYSLSPRRLGDLFPDRTNLGELLAFFSETAPAGVVGSFTASRIGGENPPIRFKHHFIVSTLEDQILVNALEAIRDQRMVEFTNAGPRREQAALHRGTPVKILVSVQTGRRYLMVRLHELRRFSTFRLDYIKALTPLPEREETDWTPEAEQQLSAGWGAAHQRGARRERIAMTIAADEEREGYIVQRLVREGRGGQVERVGHNLFRYSNSLCDTSEMLGWVKTFTGRIVSLEGDNQAVLNRFYQDMERMAAMYGGEG